MKKLLFFFLILILNLSFISKSLSQSSEKIEIIGYGPLYDDLCYPLDTAIDNLNRVYVADELFPYIKVYDRDGNFLFNFGSFGDKEGKFMFPFAIDIDRLNNKVAVIDSLKRFKNINRVQIFDLQGNFILDLKEFRDEKFGSPVAVEFDNNGNIFVLTNGDKGVKVFNKDGKLIKEIVDKKYIYGCVDFAINPINNKIYILCAPKWTEQKVHIFNMEGSFISNFTKDNFYWPNGIDIDEEGLVYVSNDGEGTVEIFDLNGKFIKNFGGSGIITSYNLRPQRLSVFNKIVVIADTFNGRVNIFTDEGQFISQIGKTKNLTDLFVYPTDVDIDSKGNIYIIDYSKMKVSKFDKSFTPILSFGGYTEQNKLNSLIWPWGIFIFSDNEIFITNRYWYGSGIVGKFKKFDSKGNELMRFGTPGNKSNQYEGPSGICGDKYGNLYIADYANSRVQKVKSNGDFLKIFELEDKNFFPLDVAVDSNVYLYVADPYNDRIVVFDKNGKHIKTFNERATGIYIDNLDRIWISNPDLVDYPIKILDSEGNIIKQFGGIGGPLTIGNVLNNKEDYYKYPGKFFYPLGLTLKGDFLYVADCGNKRVQKIPLKLIFQDLSIYLKTPFDNEIIYEDKLTFLWEVKDDLNNQYYEIQISGSEDFNNILFEKESLIEKQIEIDSNIFNKNKIYYWRVRGYNDLSYGGWSQVYKFKIGEIVPPSTIDIINTYLEKNKIKLEWSKSKDETFPIDGYEIYRGEKEENMSLLITLDKDTNFYIDDNIEFNKTYYYSIRSFDSFKVRNYSEFSKIVSIKIEDINPPQIFLTLPNETNISNLIIEGSISDDISGIKESSIYINGSKVPLSQENKFNYKINLSEGLNTIKIEAIDNAGNKSVREYKIRYINRITIVLQLSNLLIYVNDNPQEIDVPPQIIEGRTFLPIRCVAEPLGASIQWDPIEKKVTLILKEITLELWIGKNFAKVNGASIPIDPNNPKVVPMIIQGRTMLPVRFVAENLGCKVDWNSQTKTIVITYPSP